MKVSSVIHSVTLAVCWALTGGAGLLAPNALAAVPRSRIEGFVRNQTGAAIPNAQVVLRAGRSSATRTTDFRGRYDFETVEGPNGTIAVNAKGFAPLEQKWTIQDGATLSLELVLVPATLSQGITVTATRSEVSLSETAASVTVLKPEELASTAALTLDDALRQVPGFSLLRRSSSRTANPTSQGVSLRGVGASGASRALVLVDDVPLNDPFGGWIYWDRIPRESINGVDVLRGAASGLYGTDALGGVINIGSRQPANSVLSLETSYGNERTPDVSFSAGWRMGRWGVETAADASRSDGYVIVGEPDRGRVDTPANSSHTAYDFTLERAISGRGHVFATGSIFGEWRQNGTPLQRNRTHIRQLALGGDWQSGQAGLFSARAYGGPEVFNQDFSSIAPDRNSETLIRSQRVPAHEFGGSAQWSRPVRGRETLVAGFEAREVRGSSDELVFAGGRINSAVDAGGRERSAGIYGEDLIRLTPRWIVTLGARVDHWRNYDALRATRPLAPAGASAVIDFPDRAESAFSPQVSVVHKLSEKVSLTASGYRAFRAPTLNELYRSFRVGNVMTLANDQLRAERLTGGEAGARARVTDKLDLRGTFFWSEIARPIANVTLSILPTLITRERQNLGRTRSRGVELDAEARWTPSLSVSAGYEFSDATVVHFPADPALEGLLIPLVPRHAFAFRARYSNPARITLGIQGRYEGSEFDDDQNQLRLNPYFTLDALVSRSLGRGVEVFAAAENLFDQRDDVGRTPIRTIGPPLLVRAGIRIQVGLH